MNESSVICSLCSIVFSQVFISISYSFQHTIQTYHYTLLVWHICQEWHQEVSEPVGATFMVSV